MEPAIGRVFEFLQEQRCNHCLERLGRAPVSYWIFVGVAAVLELSDEVAATVVSSTTAAACSVNGSLLIESGSIFSRCSSTDCRSRLSSAAATGSDRFVTSGDDSSPTGHFTDPVLPCTDSVIRSATQRVEVETTPGLAGL